MERNKMYARLVGLGSISLTTTAILVVYLSGPFLRTAPAGTACTDSESPTPMSSPSPTDSPSPTGSPLPLPTDLPTVLPTALPTGSPSPTPSPTSSNSPSAERRCQAEISIAYKERENAFKGRIDSEEARCERRRRVVLMEVRNGKDETVARGRSQRSGAWHISQSARQGRYYARAKQFETVDSHGAQLVCETTRSRTIRAGD